MAAIIDFVVKRRIGRREYWIAMPILALAGSGGWFLTAWSYGRRANGLWLLALTELAAVAALTIWIALRRMRDSGSTILWLVAISLGGRLWKLAVHMFGGSPGQEDAALDLFFLLIFLALGSAPSRRAPSVDERPDVETGGRAPL